MEKILIAALKKKYQNKPIAFIKRFYYEETIPIAESFINLAIIRQQESKHKEREELTKAEEFRDNRLRSFEDINQSKHAILLAEIFIKGEDREAPKHVLIEGRAGIGKSTLCCYLANRWAVGDEEKLGTWIHQFIAVIWLPLRQLRDFSNLQTIAAFIHQVCLPSEDQKQITIQQVDKALTKLEQNHQVLYLLDGYDEVAGLANETLPFSPQLTLRADLLQTLLRKEYVLLTSRPYCGATQAGERKPDRHLENIGFIDEDIPQYVKQFFKNEFNELEKAESLLKLFEQNTTIKGIAYVPINLELICTVWKEEQQPSVPDNKVLTVTMLYRRILQLLIRRYLQERCKINTTKMLPKHYETHPRCNKMLAFLEALSWKLMEKNQLIFKPGDEDISDLIEKYFPDLQEQDAVNDDIYKHFGLLKGIGDEKTAWADQEHYIIHLTFQEFFAARYAVKHLLQETTFIRSHKYHPRYEIVWWFVAGLLQQSQDKEKLQIYFDALLGEPKTFHEIDQLSLVWRCWDEAGLPEIKQHKELQGRLLAHIENLPNYWNEASASSSDAAVVLLDCLEPSLNLRQQSEVKKRLIKKIANFLKNENALLSYKIYEEWFTLVNEGPAEIIEVLQERLQRKYDTRVRTAALKCLVKLKLTEETFIKKLRTLLRDKDGNIRASAIVGLVKLGIRDQVFIKKLFALLQDEKSYVRIAGIVGLVKLEVKEKACIEKLFALLKDDYEVSRAAMIGLIQLGIKKEAIVPVLMGLLQHTDKLVRVTAITALLELEVKENEFIQVLSALSQDDNDKYVQVHAIVSLLKLGVKKRSFTKQLLALSQDKDAGVRITAITNLINLEVKGEAVIQVLMASLQDNDPAVRAFAIPNLFHLRIGNETFIKTLFALLQDEDGNVRISTIKGLVKLGIKDETFVKKLLVLARDEDRHAQESAIDVLNRLKLSEQTWFNCLASWTIEWLALPLSLSAQRIDDLLSAIPLRVLLRLWTEKQQEVLEFIALKIKGHLVYWDDENLYFSEQQLEKFPLSKEQYLALYEAFLKKLEEPPISDEEFSSDFEEDSEIFSFDSEGDDEELSDSENLLVSSTQVPDIQHEPGRNSNINILDEVFIRAAQEENIALLQELLNEGVDINVKDSGQTQAPALLHAASVGNPKTVKWLLDAGADPTIIDANGETAIDWAKAGDNSDEIVSILQEHCAKQTSCNSRKRKREEKTNLTQSDLVPHSTYASVLSGEIGASEEEQTQIHRNYAEFAVKEEKPDIGDISDEFNNIPFDDEDDEETFSSDEMEEGNEKNIPHLETKEICK